VNRSTASSIGISILRGEGPSHAARARIWAALAMTLGSLPVSACAPAVSRMPRGALDPCEATLPGRACEISVDEGDTPVRSRCEKQLDGTLVCDVPEQANRDGRERVQ
jgi:hypothetical protein